MHNSQWVPHTGVLLVNLGTPNSYKVSDVRKYLCQFLMDKRVLDIPTLLRFFLVYGVIAPFRAPKSAKAYEILWTDRGSPLLYTGQDLCQLVQQYLGDNFKVALAMRYQNPSISFALQKILETGIRKLIVLPLFPQYASATTGSVIESVSQIISKRQIIPELKIISNYFQHPLYIGVFADLANRYLNTQAYDHVLFSYHGLPERQIKKADSTHTCLIKKNCCEQIHAKNYFCYRAQCFETTKRILEKLNLGGATFSTVFQSRLGKDPWIKPYADEEIVSLARSGKKKILCLVPSFVADCLETTLEVGQEYKELFLEHGGEQWQMVESLNTNPKWVQAVVNLIEEQAR